MAAITSLGIGSGLDLETMVTQLIEIEKQPITRIEKQKETYDAELSGIGQLASALSKIQAAAADMKPTGINTSYADHYKEYKANIINKDVANVEVKSGGKPAMGSYQLGVEQLATNHRLATNGVNSSDAFQAGTLKIQTGKYDEATNTYTSNDLLTVEIKEGDSLATIRDKINAGVGNVSATIISGDDGDHLVLIGKDTGTATTIKVSAEDIASSDPAATGKKLSDVFSFDPTQTDPKQATISTKVDNTTTFDDGKIKIQLGDKSAEITVDVSSGNNLEKIAENINAKLQSEGISAEVKKTDDGNKSYLVFTKSDGSEITDLKVSAETTGTGTGTKLEDVFSFASNKLSDSEYGGGKAQDAIITLNGVKATRSSNFIDDVVDGLSIELYAPTKKDEATGKYETTTITVSNDAKSKVKDALDNFVKTFNEQKTAIYDLGKYDKDTKEMGILQGRSIMRTSQNLLKSMLSGGGVKGSQYQNLASIGVAFTKTGELELDSTKLTRALEADYEGVMGLVGNVINNVNDKLETFLGSQGSITNAKNSINNILARLDNKKTTLERHVEQVEARMRKQFTAMDKVAGQWQSMGNYITQLVDSMNAAASKK